jgi:hypothetical protein
MSDHIDPVDRALQSLGGRQWPNAAGNSELEQRLMQSYGTQSTTSFFARHRVLIPTVAILAMAVAGFAAVGGVGMIKSWFATVTVNGKVVHTGEIVPDENGQATITLPESSLPPGEQKQVSVTLDGNATEGSGTTTVTVTGSESGVVVQTQSQPDPAAENKKE